jgi:hypothetical protein
MSSENRDRKILLARLDFFVLLSFPVSGACPVLLGEAAGVISCFLFSYPHPPYQGAYSSIIYVHVRMSIQKAVATHKNISCQVSFHPKCGMIEAWLHGCINRFPKRPAMLTGSIGAGKAGTRHTSRTIRSKCARQSARRGKLCARLCVRSRQGSRILSRKSRGQLPASTRATHFRYKSIGFTLWERRKRKGKRQPSSRVSA